LASFLPGYRLEPGDEGSSPIHEKIRADAPVSGFNHLLDTLHSHFHHWPRYRRPHQFDASRRCWRRSAETLRHALDLDKPIYIQYWTFITGFLQGDLGQSIRVRQPVTELVKERAANPIKLALAVMSLTVLLGVPLGVLCAVKRNSFQDTLAKIFAILGQSMPMFWMGIVLIQVFAGQLDLLPASGTGGRPTIYSRLLLWGYFSLRR
jgi:ABC-type dipeptide/oligopeptide/nickel transport system permease component